MRSTCFSFYKTNGAGWALALVLVFLLGGSHPSLLAKSDDLPLFTPVNDWLYRGAQPEEEGFQTLKAKKIRTVINFRHESKRIKWEKEKVEALGMKYVSLPWSITMPVKPELVDQFFEVLDDPKNRPVFFHCEHGRDRSGVMTVLALMRYEKLPEEEARSMALETIHPHLRYRYFVNRKIEFFRKYLEGKEHQGKP